MGLRPTVSLPESTRHITYPPERREKEKNPPFSHQPFPEMHAGKPQPVGSPALGGVIVALAEILPAARDPLLPRVPGPAANGAELTSRQSDSWCGYDCKFLLP